MRINDNLKKMRQENIYQYQGEAEIFKALSHPTRLFILHKIRNKSYSVSDLAVMAGIDISTMSKHLDVLKRYKIIAGEKNKNNMFYKINIPCIFNFLDCAKSITSCHIDCGEEQCSNIKLLTKK